MSHPSYPSAPFCGASVPLGPVPSSCTGRSCLPGVPLEWSSVSHCPTHILIPVRVGEHFHNLTCGVPSFTGQTP